MHLRYSLMDAHLKYGEKRHALAVMKDLGITYQYATPQSIADSWWFWNCENVPAELPGYIVELKIDPFKVIGLGLNQELAEMIAARGTGELMAKPSKTSDN